MPVLARQIDQDGNLGAGGVSEFGHAVSIDALWRDLPPTAKAGGRVYSTEEMSASSAGNRRNTPRFAAGRSIPNFGFLDRCRMLCSMVGDRESRQVVADRIGAWIICSRDESVVPNG